MVQVHTLVVGRLQTNCYILASKGEALVVDPGDEAARILRYVNDLKAKLKTIVATHTHFDHVLGVTELKTQTGAPFLVHKDDLETLEAMQERVRMFFGLKVPAPPKIDGFFKDGDSVKFGDETLKVLHTPGHSPGSISLVGDGYVITGDALFNQSIGRTDLPGGDFDTLINSIKSKLFALSDDTMVYPGHGPETSIGDERLANPFVGRMALRVG
jgi:glyoxylase-like metal-dependent hydrolase (beta-lactamase superfamily II)